jgi:hypothetical protein
MFVKFINSLFEMAWKGQLQISFSLLVVHRRCCFQLNPLAQNLVKQSLLIYFIPCKYLVDMATKSKLLETLLVETRKVNSIELKYRLV